MTKKSLKKRFQDLKAKKSMPTDKEEKPYEEINNRSFNYNFKALIRHYKKRENSLPLKSK